MDLDPRRATALPVVDVDYGTRLKLVVAWSSLVQP